MVHEPVDTIGSVGDIDENVHVNIPRMKISTEPNMINFHLANCCTLLL